MVNLLAAHLRQIEAAELPTAEKVAPNSDPCRCALRAIGVDVMDKRLEATGRTD